MNEVGVQKFRCTVRKREDPEKVEILTREAATLEEALASLQANGYLVISIELFSEMQKAGVAGARGASFRFDLFRRKFQPQKVVETKMGEVAESSAKQERFLPFYRVGTRELISFAIQLATLLKSGIPLLNSLKIIHRGIQNRYFHRVLEELMADVSGGFPLHYGLRRHLRVFPPIWGNLVEVGEVSGTLVDVLEEIARYQEAAQRIKSKVISAFFYPAILLTMVTGAVVFLLVQIIPKFKEIFRGMDIKLPPLTEMVILASDILRNYSPFVILFLFTSFFVVRWVTRSRKGHLIVDSLFLKLPVFGNLILQVSIVRFARSLATLLKAGIPVLDALKTAAKLSENFLVGNLIEETHEGVKAGHGLGHQLEKSGLFPLFMTQLISVGEESGELVRFLSLVSNYYEERVDTFLGRLSTVIEPIMLVFVGAIVGTIVISIFLPLVSISTMGG